MILTSDNCFPPTWLIQVFPSRKVLNLQVSKVARFWIYGGFGQFILKGLKVLCARHSVLSLCEYSYNPVATGAGLATG